MADDPLYPRQRNRITLGTITQFDPIPLTDVPIGMLKKLGAPEYISAADMLVEQTLDKGIAVYYMMLESDEQYWERVNAAKAAAAEQIRQDAIDRETIASWNKFKELSVRFADRILQLTIKDEWANT